MKILLAFDSFKGSLTADEAVLAAREGVLLARPDAEIVSLPLADGGEGTAAILARLTDARWETCRVCDPLFRETEARFAISRDGRTAVMEMASAAGLMLLRDSERNPMKTTTYGVGQMILEAVRRGCRRILIGIGGSATNDGGIGMLAALGACFLDCDNKALKPVGESLQKIAHIDWQGMADLSGVTIDVVCDVQNPLFGENGAARVFARQKGANREETEELDEGLRHFASICRFCPSPDWGRSEGGFTPGSGAAGGLGYGLLLLGARLRRGTDIILDAARFDEHLQGADLVLTGEGKLDSQTLCGKLPFGVLQRARKQDVPVIALAGKIEDESLLLEAGFHAIHSINPEDLSPAETMRPDVAKENLKQTIKTIVQ